MAQGASQEALGWRNIQKVVAIFSVWTDKKPNKALLDEAANYIDYSEMAEKSIGPQWFKLSPLDKKEYAFVLRKLIEDKYYRRWNKILSKGKVEKLKVVDTKDSLYVKTRLTAGGDEDLLVWRLSKRDGKYRVISIAADEKDLLTRMSIRVRKRLSKDGFDKLIAWMKDKADIEEMPTRIRSTASK